MSSKESPEGRNRKYDLTEGNILNKLLLVALPIIGTQLILLSYNLTDMFMLGRIGSDAVAASGAAGMYMWLSNGLMLLSRMGAEIGVAQNMGGGDVSEARRYSQNSLCLAILTGLTYAAVCAFFSDPLIGFFHIQEEEVAANAKSYLSIVAVGMPATFVTAAIAGTFNGSGNSRVPFFINAVGLLLNVTLDPLFIFVFDMEVAGAAVATVIAQAVGCALSLWAVTQKSDRPFVHYLFWEKPQRRHMAQIFAWSLPVSIESILFAFLTMVLSRFVTDFGAQALAVYRVGSQIESLCWLTGVGFASAITAFVGQNYGAGEWGRIRSCWRIAIMYTSLWGATVTMILIGAGGTLFSLFLRDPELVEMGATFLRIMAISQVLSCWEASAGGSFRGLGRTLPPSIVTTVSNGLRVLLAYFLARGDLGLEGIWWSIAVGASLRGVWIFSWYLRKLRTLPVA
jgi:putative MATE family efflux protein